MTRVETILGSFKQPSGKPGFALRIPDEARCLFPPNGDQYTNLFMITGTGTGDSVWVAERHGPRQLDHIHITATNWWKELSPKPSVGSVVVIEVTESEGVRQYHIQ